MFASKSSEHRAEDTPDMNKSAWNITVWTYPQSTTVETTLSILEKMRISEGTNVL